MEYLAAGQEKDACINFSFREWVEKEFKVEVPDRGCRIADLNDKTFGNWIEEQRNKYAWRSL